MGGNHPAVQPCQTVRQQRCAAGEKESGKSVKPVSILRNAPGKPVCQFRLQLGENGHGKDP